jgi:hypothetical protein
MADCDVTDGPVSPSWDRFPTPRMGGMSYPLARVDVGRA